MKHYRVIKDLQGGEFGMYRIYTEEQWREQALEWAEMDEHYGLIKTLKKLPTDKILPFISDIWALEFAEIDDEHFNDIKEKDIYYTLTAILVQELFENDLFDIEELAKKYTLNKDTKDTLTKIYKRYYEIDEE